MQTEGNAAQLGYTIAVCTRNRAVLLERTLALLTQQVANFADTEILIVDNKSTDTTAEAVAHFPNIRYVVEDMLGIAWGRNRAAKEARGKWIIYLDDDAFPIPEWFQVMRRTIENSIPPLHGVLGKVDLEWEQGRATWFPPSYETLLSRYDLGDQGLFLQAAGYLLTTNTAFDRDYLLQLGGFRTDLGHRGKSLLGGEDNNIFDRLMENHSRLWYEPGALVKHWVPLERQTFRWLVNRVFWDGATQPLLDYGSGQSRGWYLRHMGYDFRNAARLVITEFFSIRTEIGRRNLTLRIVQKWGRFCMNWQLLRGK